jgi:hypothetical protein
VRRPAEFLNEDEWTCTRCGVLLPREEFARDRTKTFGRRSWCRRCETERVKRYYRENRERILDERAARRRRPRPPERTTCEECDEALPEGRRVVCSERCREARFKRLHPEAYAAREARKVERRRERRRRDREAA